MGSKRQRRFQVRELAKLLDIKPRQVEGWVEQGLLKPAVRARGPGRRREFSLDNLIQGAILLELQGTFGEKSPVWGRAFPGVVKAVKGFSLDVPQSLFLIVGQEEGKVTQTKVIKGGIGELIRQVYQDSTGSVAMTIVDLTSIIMRLHHRLE